MLGRDGQGSLCVSSLLHVLTTVRIWSRTTQALDMGNLVLSFAAVECLLYCTPSLVPSPTRYVVALGSKVLAAWSAASSNRARRRAGAAVLAHVLSSGLRRRACRRWASQAAAATIEADQTVAALEHCYDRCLRSHLWAWSVLARNRRLLRRGVGLLSRGRSTAVIATGFRVWRRRAAEVREEVLRDHRVKVSWVSFFFFLP